MIDESIRAMLVTRLNYSKKEKGKIEWIYNLALKYFNVTGMSKEDLDSTGVRLKSKLVNKLCSIIVNSNYIWAHIEPPKWAEVSQEDRNIFEHHTRVVFDDIQELSNFELEKIKILNDYMIGTTAFKVEYTGDISSPSKIRHAPISNIYVVENARAEVQDVFFKNENMTRNKIIEIWPEAKDIDDMDDRSETDIWEGTIYNHRTKKYIYVVSPDEGFSKVIYSEELEDTPWVVARWEPFENNIPYGCGPASKAILEMMGLKKTRSNIRKIGDFQTNPPLLAYGDPRLALRAKLIPGHLSYMGQKDNVAELRPFSNGANPTMDFFNMDEYKDALNELFYVDFITSIKNVDDLKNITATTTQIAVSKFAEQIDPVYSRLQKEMLKPTVMKIYANNLRAHVISQQNIQYLKDNPRIAIRFYNAITIAQDQDDLERANMFIQDIASKFGPQALAAIIKSEEHIAEQAKRFRVSGKEFRTGAEASQKLQEIQQNTMAPQEMAMEGAPQ